jgi:hypothetical protein
MRKLFDRGEFWSIGSHGPSAAWPVAQKTREGKGRATSVGMTESLWGGERTETQDGDVKPPLQIGFSFGGKTRGSTTEGAESLGVASA